MKDYKQYHSYVYTQSKKAYPNFAIGTYLRTEEELRNLLDQYPYDTIMLDTAFRYGNESAVARAVEGSQYPRENVIYIGKINTFQQDCGRTVREEFLATLERLHLDKINIYLIHSDRSPNITATWQEMILLRKLGLIDTIGISNFSIASIEKIYAASGIYPEVMQLVLPTDQFDTEFQKLLQYCHEKEILIQIASPFGGMDGSKKLSQTKRRELLKDICSQGYTCVFGTTSIIHLNENVSWMNRGEEISKAVKCVRSKSNSAFFI